jgi:hypothetical protein
MSFEAIRWAMKQTTGSASAKVVLLALADAAGKDGAVILGQAAIAERTELKERAVRNALRQLEERGLLSADARYRKGGSRTSNMYRLTIPAPDAGMVANRHEMPGGIPALDAGLVPTVLEPEETTTPPTPPSGGEGGVRKKRPARRWPSKRTPRSKRRPLDPFEVAWRLYPKRAGGNSKAEARKAWRARLRSGVRAEDLTAGVQRYAAFVRGTGKEHTVYVKQAASFFGPAEHWTEDWTLPKNGNGTRPRPPTIFATPEEVRRSTPPPARPVKSRMMVEHEERQRRAAGGER